MKPQTANRPSGKRYPPKKAQPDSRTKFDVWLESHITTGEIVTFVFKEAPLHVAVGKVLANARIMTVDRYTVYMEIEVLENGWKVGDTIENPSVSASKWVPVWVTKDNIISAQ